MRARDVFLCFLATGVWMHVLVTYEPPAAPARQVAPWADSLSRLYTNTHPGGPIPIVYRAGPVGDEAVFWIPEGYYYFGDTGGGPMMRTITPYIPWRDGFVEPNASAEEPSVQPIPVQDAYQHAVTRYTTDDEKSLVVEWSCSAGHTYEVLWGPRGGVVGVIENGKVTGQTDCPYCNRKEIR